LASLAEIFDGNNNMQSKARDVASYIDEAPSDRREALMKLRQLCLETLDGYEEAMDYLLPCYKKDGIVEVAFANQKNYISIYFLKDDVIKSNRSMLAGLNLGKACIRYMKPEKINFAVIKKLLDETRKLKSPKS
jgi:uncharacterized protein YdhG (YjbR/CyaY superfamily)